jgi:thioredoxin 1
MSELTALTAAEFDEAVVRSETPAVVDFWAPWCGPCKMVTAQVEEIARELSGRVNAFKVNVDEQQEIAVRYSVRSLPTLLLFKGGEVKEQLVGAQSKAAILAKVEGLISE